MKWIRSYIRHLRDGMRNLFRNGWMTSASIIVMSLTLFLLGTFLVLVLNINQLTETIENEIQVRVMIDPLAEVPDEQKLGNEIANIDHVTKVIYRSAEDELATYQEVITEDFDVLKDKNPLNNMYLVTVDSANSLEAVTEEVKSLKWVQNANIGSINLEGLIQSIDVLRYVIAILGTIFILIAILLVSNTIKITIQSRSREIEIMELVGAKKSYIKAPFVIEGGCVGIIGAVFSSIGLYFSYQAILSLAQELLAFNPNYAMPIYPNILYIAGVLVVLGYLLGILAAKRAVNKSLK
ncbi:permease-like cell division protein FtsX [Facklamia miroungae]|uniref:Cell division protein FtsX n=1 Tax=Facklamia miroungae TaxID=120956 RepID=A0A1G7SG71_9LACT|nr:permease-like cell division protein FtsX [Facklamia miroungae]NKZ29661.1 ABC transporter permease [Facklamia miroungae]SDG22065.1 cell division transport system permease protein [Facklamia miroungae]